jgi:hypothetical protein
VLRLCYSNARNSRPKIRCSPPSLSVESPREPPGRVGILVARLALMSPHGVFAEARLGIPQMGGSDQGRRGRRNPETGQGSCRSSARDSSSSPFGAGTDPPQGVNSDVSVLPSGGSMVSPYRRDRIASLLPGPTVESGHRISAMMVLPWGNTELRNRTIIVVGDNGRVFLEHPIC